MRRVNSSAPTFQRVETFGCEAETIRHHPSHLRAPSTQRNIGAIQQRSHTDETLTASPQAFIGTAHCGMSTASDAMRPGSKVTCRGRHLCLGKGDDVTPHGL